MTGQVSLNGCFLQMRHQIENIKKETKSKTVTATFRWPDPPAYQIYEVQPRLNSLLFYILSWFGWLSSKPKKKQKTLGIQSIRMELVVYVARQNPDQEVVKKVNDSRSIVRKNHESEVELIEVRGWSYRGCLKERLEWSIISIGWWFCYRILNDRWSWLATFLDVEVDEICSFDSVLPQTPPMVVV